MNYAVAIPSYKRHEGLVKNTLATLLRMKVSPDKIHVFVADKKEKEVYDAALKGSGVRVLKGVPGLFAQRQFYNRYFKKGTPLLNVDDDLFELMALNTKGKLSPCQAPMDDIVEYAFECCKSMGSKLWGISAVENHFYMDNETVAGLRYICGILHGSYAGDEVILGKDRPVVSSGEDFETTLRSFRAYGSVVRLNWLCPKTKYFAPGGMQHELGGQEQRNKDHSKELANIAKRHAGLCSLYQKNGGVTNLKLKALRASKLDVPAWSLAKA